MYRIIGLAVLLTANACLWAQRYEITRVEAPHGSVGAVYVEDVNDRGQVVGRWRDAGGNDRAFFWENGVSIDLGSFGGDATRAASINNAGTVVGDSEDASGANHAFVWTKRGGMQRLFSGRTPTWARSISEAGDIVAQTHKRAYLISDGITTVLPLRFPNGSSYVMDINDGGEIVGGDFASQSEFPYPTIWVKGVSYGLAGGFSTFPTRINNKGQIVGYTLPGWSLGVPVTWINRQIHYLPMIDYGGTAEDVDEEGLIVGSLHDENHGNQAVVWRDLQFSNLNNEEFSAAGWHLSSAKAINEQGQIVGNGRFGNSYASFLLTPVSR